MTGNNKGHDKHDCTRQRGGPVRGREGQAVPVLDPHEPVHCRSDRHGCAYTSNCTCVCPWCIGAGMLAARRRNSQEAAGG